MGQSPYDEEWLVQEELYDKSCNGAMKVNDDYIDYFMQNTEDKYYKNIYNVFDMIYKEVKPTLTYLKRRTY